MSTFFCRFCHIISHPTPRYLAVSDYNKHNRWCQYQSFFSMRNISLRILPENDELANFIGWLDLRSIEPPSLGSNCLNAVQIQHLNCTFEQLDPVITARAAMKWLTGFSIPILLRPSAPPRPHLISQPCPLDERESAAGPRNRAGAGGA